MFPKKILLIILVHCLTFPQKSTENKFFISAVSSVLLCLFILFALLYEMNSYVSGRPNEKHGFSFFVQLFIAFIYIIVPAFGAVLKYFKEKHFADKGKLMSICTFAVYPICCLPKILYRLTKQNLIFFANQIRDFRTYPSAVQSTIRLAKRLKMLFTVQIILCTAASVQSVHK